MSAITNLLWQLRQKISDPSDVAYSVYDKLTALNAGNRYIREYARKYNPDMLYLLESGTASTAANTLTATPVKVMEVRVAGALIQPIDPRTIPDKTLTGDISRYWLTANKVMNWYPVPRTAQAFTVEMLPTATEWDETSTSDWIVEIEDCIVEFAAALLTKQQGDVLTLADRVVSLISNRETGDSSVTGYWNSGGSEVDY